MSRTALPRTLLATAVLFGLVSTGFASIALVKAPRREGVSVEETLSEPSSSGACKRIAIVDAPRRNPYERRFREYSHGLAPIGEDGKSIVIASTSPEQVVEEAGTLPNRFVNGLAAEIGRSSLPVEEILAASAAASPGDRREQEHSGVPVASNVSG